MRDLKDGGARGGGGFQTGAAEVLSSRGGAPGFYRFRHEDAMVTVLSDGRVHSRAPSTTFRGAPPEEIDRLVTDHFLPTDRLVLEENVVCLEIGGGRILFDCGLGSSPLFGGRGGRLVGNMAAAGIDPGTIAAVVLSHGHPDHLGGLVDDSGAKRFPAADVFINRLDFEYWMSEDRTGPVLGAFRDLAIAQLEPYRGRLRFIADGQEILPGVQAVFSPGHTIGHTHFLVSSGGRLLALTADLSRHHLLGVETRWEFSGDFDPRESVETRERHFARFAAERIPILSYHYPWPGLGHIVRHRDGFRFLPTAMDLSG
ncbi:MAG: MBL fold metallo-hydrolase [Rhodospirillum sp.]|nr:MBL fold metallo-hydrolase [Rhodospirillum sp.]MCF8490583.1 MBL fold metallo-hydrolase [Rhodospirillum sp.]MCF8502717.1 MBL fold metallo-hydrolase [Rhodospirillum sp.]